MGLDPDKRRQRIRGGMGLRFVGCVVEKAPRNPVVCFRDGGSSHASVESQVIEASNHGTYAWGAALGSGIIALCRHPLVAQSNVDRNAVKCRLKLQSSSEA